MAAQREEYHCLSSRTGRRKRKSILHMTVVGIRFCRFVE